ncbi:MAG: hypothetical protein JW797_10405 [Bradymonadales bacterium]|nr:hypothetical protein [Bradymonadales bacterium]
MHTRIFYATTIITLLWLANLAIAQQPVLNNDQFGVGITLPEGWSEVEGNERAIFNFKHEESQSQIEIIATQLMSTDVANVFYDTFHETLEQSNFERQNVASETIGAYTGTLTHYLFAYAGVQLKIVVFQFTRESTAYLVVGYIKADEFDALFPGFQAAVSNLTFQS